MRDPARLSRREEKEARFRRDQFRGLIDADAEPPEYDDYPQCEDDSDE